jgi:hypothetical protein
MSEKKKEEKKEIPNPIFKYEFTLKQVEALATFLNRVDLKGIEVPMFNSVISSLSNPVGKVTAPAASSNGSVTKPKRKTASRKKSSPNTK